jgi:hypothetical protein
MHNLAYRSESGRESTSRLAVLADVEFDAPANITRPRVARQPWRTRGPVSPVTVTQAVTGYAADGSWVVARDAAEWLSKARAAEAAAGL